MARPDDLRSGHVVVSVYGSPGQAVFLLGQAACFVLLLAAIHLDDVCQSRVITDLNLAGEYAEAMLLGAQFSPVVVFDDGTDGYWLADGCHRRQASQSLGCRPSPPTCHLVGWRETILYSVGANAEHGLRRTNDDKRRAVRTLLNDPEWRE